MLENGRLRPNALSLVPSYLLSWLIHFGSQLNIPISRPRTWRDLNTLYQFPRRRQPAKAPPRFRSPPRTTFSAILDDEADAFPFLKLPRELRDIVYEYVAGSLIQHNIVFDPVTACTRSLGEHSVDNRKPRGSDNNDKASVQYAMVLVYRQVSDEFLEAVCRFIPLHLAYCRDTWASYNSKFFSSPQEGTRWPTVTHMYVKPIFYSTVEAGESSEDFQRQVLETRPFQHFTKKLVGCHQLTHLAIRCVLSMDDPHWNINRYVPPNLYVAFDCEKCRAVYEHLRTVIESLPNLLQYSLEVLISKWHWCDFTQARYSSRVAGHRWDSTQSTHFTFDKRPNPRAHVSIGNHRQNGRTFVNFCA